MKIIKTYNAIVKGINEETHTATVIISTKDADRDGEVVMPEAFKKRRKTYEGHPVLLSSHNYFNLMNQIGEAKKTKFTNDGVESEFEWYVGKGNPEADWGWFLATKGIAAFSIGFIAHAWENGEFQADKNAFKNGIRRTYTDIEHLETSQVLIPSNRGAVQSRRGIGEDSELCELALKSFTETDWPEIEKTFDIGRSNQRASFITPKELDLKLIERKNSIIAESLNGVFYFKTVEDFNKAVDEIIETKKISAEFKEDIFGEAGARHLKADLNEKEIDELAAKINKELKQTIIELKK